MCIINLTITSVSPSTLPIFGPNSIFFHAGGLQIAQCFRTVETLTLHHRTYVRLVRVYSRLVAAGTRW